MSASETRCHHALIFKTTWPIAILTGVLVTASASAETADTSTPDLGEVVVTAQRRSESLLSVAAPVTSLSSADLARQGDVRLTDYAATVPGLNLISSQPGQSVVIIRGINTGFGAAIPATTATYIDDVPYGSSTASAYGSIATLDLDPATLQRVEVLRGPQGTLYGASAMGGLIKYVTARPSLTTYGARMQLDGSSIDGGGQGYGVRAMFDGPLVNDLLGITISGFKRVDPGYIDDPHRNRKNVNSSHVDGGRLALLFQPTDKFTANFAALIQDTKTGGTSDVDLNLDQTPIYGKYQQVRYGNEDWEFHNRVYSLSLNYDLGWSNLTSITSYATRTARWGIEESVKFGPLISGLIGVPNIGVFDNITLDNNKTTQELRLASPDNDTLEWLGGFFFTREHSLKPEAFGQPISLTTDLPVPAAYTPGGFFNDTLHDSYREYAGYADVTYHFTSQFKVLGGLRYSTNSEQSVTPYSGLLNGPATVTVGDSSDHSLTYLFSPSFTFDDHNMAYIRIASGYRPGGPTGVTSTDIYGGAPTTYKPDSLTSYEIGYKGSLPELRMTIDISAFDIEWKDIQVLSEVNGFFITGNGAKARSSGAEFNWTWKPLTGLNLSANGAYTDARMTADSPAISAKSGDELPNVPKYSANVAADYDFPITTDVTGFVGTNYQYMGARVVDFISGVPAGYVRPEMPAYDIVNLRGGISRRGLTIEGYIKNVADTYGFARLRSEVRDGYSSPLAAAIIQPRTYGLSVGYKY
jgi:iron complex outermembrane recepter protein